MKDHRTIRQLMAASASPLFPLGGLLVGGVLGILLPAAIIALANVVQLYETTIVWSSTEGTSHASRPFDVTSLLPTPVPQQQLLLLCGGVVAIVVLVILFRWALGRLVAGWAIRFHVAAIEKVYAQSKGLARRRTLSTHRELERDCLEVHLPQMHETLSLWWRTVPRAPVTLGICLALMFVVDSVMAATVVVAIALGAASLRAISTTIQRSRSVWEQRGKQAAAEMERLVIQAPLIELAHPHEVVQQHVHEAVQRFAKATRHRLLVPERRRLALLAIGGLLGCLLLIVGVLRGLNAENPTSVAGCLLFLAAAGGAWQALWRVRKLIRRTDASLSAAEQLLRFLDLPSADVRRGPVQLEDVAPGVVLDHVTLQDIHGRTLLNEVTAELSMGKLIGVMSRDPNEARALWELALGFGLPSSGKVTIGGQHLEAISTECLDRLGHWVAPDGALLTGTLRENLADGSRLSDLELTDLVRDMGLEELLQVLDEGLATVISVDDDRIHREWCFRIGLARALAKKPKLCVIEEPVRTGDADEETETWHAERKLVDPGRVTLVLPRRLVTLRNCAEVLVLDGGRLVDRGPHVDLLKRSELYRHLNYVTFNAF
ncbi:MAG: lantibiotic mersacidin transporter system [Pirellulaceae bacterium]|nr:MAG: lantibiotic mersacidin transporter system [Pirellulaceae bacterium]